jgi:hypothetical protein
MNLTKLTTTSFLALSLALPAGAALSQDKTLNTNPIFYIFVLSYIFLLML